jgi:hypothetical protein
MPTGSSIGAGAAKSVGKKILALVANRATKNTKIVRRGAIYCRKKAINY